MRTSLSTLVLLTYLRCAMAPVQAASTLAWIDASRKFACAGTYARVKPLADGRQALVYSRGADACIRFASKPGEEWGGEAVVARTTGYGNTNAELIELENGWLLYGWNGRPNAGGAYFIATKVSRDQGKSWGDEARVYTAGTASGTGCWEPAFLLAPGGAVEIFFANEFPYAGANTDQEIGSLRSDDHGLTWKEYAAVSHRAGARDGMPVPVRLANGVAAMAIEDNGLDGAFKPAIVFGRPGEAGISGPVPGADARRKAALAGEWRLPASVYAGAPYLARLPGGETVLSVQSTEGRAVGADPVQASVMRVYLGDAGAQGFAACPAPFPDIPAGGNGVWNSLAVLDDSTVMAVSSVRGLGRDGIWIVTGRIRRTSVALFASPAPDRMRGNPAFGPPGRSVGWSADGRRLPSRIRALLVRE
jgi:hypothetical protein